MDISFPGIPCIVQFTSRRPVNQFTTTELSEVCLE